MNTSRVGIQDCSFMCMKWLKRQVYIRNPCLKIISSCLKVEVGSSLFIPFLFFALLFFSFLFTNSSLSTCYSCVLEQSLTYLSFLHILYPVSLPFSSPPGSLHIFYTYNLQYFTTPCDHASAIYPYPLQIYFTYSAFTTNYIITIQFHFFPPLSFGEYDAE